MPRCAPTCADASAPRMRAGWAIRRSAALMAIVLWAGAMVGCGGGSGDSEEARQELRLSLGFLRSDLEPAQLRCVEAELIDSVEDLEDFSEKIRRVEDGEIEIADLPAEDEAALTDAIAACAVGGG